MTKWEYKQVWGKPDFDFELDLNLLGEEGWELVKVEDHVRGFATVYVYDLKRPKDES